MYKYCVLIPTRNRPSYLHYAIQSCLNSRKDVEVLISDNSDEANAARNNQVLQSFEKAASLRYIRPSNSPLSMSSHWAWAIRQVDAEYLIVIGDDDALIPDFFDYLDTVIAITSAELINWNNAFYYWPDHLLDSKKGVLIAPFDDKQRMRQLHTLNCKQMLRSVLDGVESYLNLPKIWHSAIHRNCVSRLMESNGGNFLPGAAPDVYSAMFINYFGDTFAQIPFSLSLNGLSGMSNGSSLFFGAPNNKISTEFLQLNKSSKTSQHSSVPFLPVTSSYVLECFEHFVQVHSTARNFYQWTTIEFARRAFEEIQLLPVKRDLKLHWLSELRVGFNSDVSVSRLLDQLFANATVSSSDFESVSGFSQGALQYNLNEQFGVTDCAAAAQWYRNIVAVKPGELTCASSQFVDVAKELVPPIALKMLRAIRSHLPKK